MPTIPSLSQAFENLGKRQYGGSRQYSSLAPAAVAAAPRPAVPNLFGAISSSLSSAYQKGQQILQRQPQPSSPRVGVSSTSALGMGSSAMPRIDAVATSAEAAGTSVGGRSMIGPTGAPGAYVPYKGGAGGAFTPYSQDGQGGASIAPPPVPQVANATSIYTKQPVYMPPPATATPRPVAPVTPAVGGGTAATSAAPVAPPSGVGGGTNPGSSGAGSFYSPQASTFANRLAPSSFGDQIGRDYMTLEEELAAIEAERRKKKEKDGSGAYDVYQEALKPSSEEENAQERLDQLNQSASTAYVNAEGQPIPLPFITGQQMQLMKEKSLLAAPLEAQLARLQAKRTIAIQGSKAAMEREDKLAERGKPVSVSEGSTLVDPTTGLPIYRSPKTADAAKAPTTMETEQGILQWNGETGQWESTGFVGTKAAEKTAAAKASAQAATEKATIVGAKINQAIPMVNGQSAGIVGASTQNIPGTPAYNLARVLDTVKANLGFQELSAMRAQSPTGGALGQVTERELAFLQATVASLDIGQDPAVLQQNLRDIATHFESWKNAVLQAAQQGGGAGGGAQGGSSLYDF